MTLIRNIFLRKQELFFALCCVLAFAKVISHATITEDAYITFRVVDNFLAGHGLRWNIDERVQVYTHPLWMLLHIPLQAVFGNIYLVSTGLSLACSITAVAVMLRIFPGSLGWKAITIILPLALSKAFSDYFVSGLENSLSFLLLAWFLYEIFRPVASFSYYRLLFITALLLFNRLDTILLITPVFLWISWMRGKDAKLSKICLAMSPLILWSIFSLWYYGFLFPNTKYAKINTGIDDTTLFWHGVWYLKNFLYVDTVSSVMVGGAVLYGLAQVIPLFRSGTFKEPHMTFLMLALGCIAHIVYVVNIGGDYMMGRFFANLVIVAVCMGHFFLSHRTVMVRWLIVPVLLTSFWVHREILNPLWPYHTSYRWLINDVTAQLLPTNGLFSQQGYLIRREPDHFWIDAGKRMAARPAVMARSIIGMTGYYAGSAPVIIDAYGLSDPLIARLPVSPDARWRIGHFRRTIPVGYLHARRTGDTSQMEPALAQYYQKLHLITAGDLWDPERLRAIVEFHFGWHDGWLKEHLQKK